ncbi:hypothetical protein BYT27DRAFT_7115702 [Phlegmacium glaucopus]|nr:hypothetical protein BYT27DRAFT_7115702 [Phlegmacium glaucopus]
MEFISERTQVPTLEDVFAVRRSLLAFVPPELANIILDEAGYWPKATWSFKPENPLVISATSSNQNKVTVCCLLSPKLCDLFNGEVKIKTIGFKIMSHDQGWCSQINFSQPYDGSYTWFEAVIARGFIYRHAAIGSSDAELEIEGIHDALELRDDDLKNLKISDAEAPNDQNSDVWLIQRNKRATQEYQLYTVVWAEEEVADGSILLNETGRGLGKGFVSSLKMDDRIAVLAKAKYPAWTNHIQSVVLEIYYSV